jgi:Acetyltransferase (GNAT) family.
MNLVFKRATAADAHTIIALAYEIWHQHYPNIISKEQIDYMLRTRYSTQKVNDGMKDGVQYFLAITNEQPIGFAAIEKQERCWFLHQFYLLPAQQRQGKGTCFLHFLLNEINHETIRLQVNRKNVNAINFYFKNGFIIERAADFDIGNGYFMNDFVMIRQER